MDFYVFVQKCLLTTVLTPSLKKEGNGESPESENDADEYNLLSVY